MKTKNVNNKRIIDWQSYKEELTSKTQSNFNEYKSDLHTMTMRGDVIKKTLLCPRYKEMCSEMEVFDQTNLDYFNYERNLTFGEFND